MKGNYWKVEKWKMRSEKENIEQEQKRAVEKNFNGMKEEG